MKPDFPIGTIVKISDLLLNPDKYDSKADPPFFLGYVQDSFAFDWQLNLDCDADETLVVLIFAGKYLVE